MNALEWKCNDRMKWMSISMSVELAASDAQNRLTWICNFIRMHVNGLLQNAIKCLWMLLVQNAPCQLNAFECTESECKWMHQVNALECSVCRMLPATWMHLNAPIPNVFECKIMHRIQNAYVCFRMLLVQNAPCQLNVYECTESECKWMHHVNAPECSAYRMLPATWMILNSRNEPFTKMRQNASNVKNL